VADIQAAMNHFWDRLEGTPGIAAHRPPKGSGSTMGGWYCAHGLYRPEELGGLSATRFCEALRAEGVADAAPGANMLLHLHPLFNDADVYGHGKPTRIAHSDRDLRQRAGSLPVSEATPGRVIWIPWFKKPKLELIDEYAEAYCKVSAGHRELLAGDTGDAPEVGGWHFYARR